MGRKGKTFILANLDDIQSSLLLRRKALRRSNAVDIPDIKHLTINGQCTSDNKVENPKEKDSLMNIVNNVQTDANIGDIDDNDPSGHSKLCSKTEKENSKLKSFLMSLKNDDDDNSNVELKPTNKDALINKTNDKQKSYGSMNLVDMSIVQMVSIVVFLFLVLVNVTSTYSHNANSEDGHWCKQITNRTHKPCPSDYQYKDDEEFTWKLDIRNLQGTEFQRRSRKNLKQLRKLLMRMRVSNDSCPFVQEKDVCCPQWTGSRCNIKKNEKSNDLDHWSTADAAEHCLLILSFGNFLYRIKYQLASVNMIGSWSIDINLKDIQTNISVLKTVNLLLNHVHVRLNMMNEISIDGRTIINGTYYKDGITIERMNEYWTQIIFANEFTFQWNKHGLYILYISDNHKGKIKGLCGNYNGAENDDNLDQMEKYSMKHFHMDEKQISYWKNDCTFKFEKKCKKYLDKHSIFRECYSKLSTDKIIEFERFINLCNEDSCNENFQETICSVGYVLSRMCFQNNIHVDWRNQLKLCQIDCGRNEIFVECATNCREDPCKKNDIISCHENCVSGCQCKDGYKRMDNGKCEKMRECGCEYGRETYLNKEEIDIDCNRCICQKGTWNCTENSCKRHCSILPTNNIRTFDGYFYMNEQFASQEEFVLVELKPTVHFLEYLQISLILTDDFHRLNLYMNDYIRYSVEFKHSYPYEVRADLNHAIIEEFPYQNNLIKIEWITTDFLSIDGETWRITSSQFGLIHVYLNTTLYFDNVFGLCGTLNDKSNDEMLTSSGIVELNTDNFIQSYQKTSKLNRIHRSLDDDNEIDFLKEIENGDYEMEEEDGFESSIRSTKCQKMFTSHLFRECNELIEPDEMIHACIQNQNNEDKLKSLIIYYLTMCEHSGIYIPNDLVQKSEYFQKFNNQSNYHKCTGNMEWQHCIDNCGLKTCRPNEKDYKCTDDAQDICLSGCACPSRMLYDESQKRCLHFKECPCYVSSRYYEISQEFHLSNCGKCKCIESGNWICENPECDNDNGISVENSGYKIKFQSSFKKRSLEGGKRECPKNQIWKKDRIAFDSSNCIEKTCENKDIWTDCGIYESGCGCPDNFVLKYDGNCIEIEECPCQYINKIYEKNEIVEQKCSKCTCQKGQWKCNKTENCASSCEIFGDAHFRTFDGRSLNIESIPTQQITEHISECQFTLIESFEKENPFRISFENVACGTQGKTCTKNIIIHYNGDNIRLLNGKDPILNGREYKLPKLGKKSINNIVFEQNTISLMVITEQFKLTWNYGMRISIDINETLRNINGICGDNDGKSENDVKSKNGKIVSSTIDYIRQYQRGKCNNIERMKRMDVTSCCIDNTLRKNWALDRCKLLQKQSSSSTFRSCLNKLSKEEQLYYYEICVKESCQCSEATSCSAMCDVMEELFNVCRKKFNMIIDYRSKDFCPFHCSKGFSYYTCGNKNCSNSCDKSECLEGCYCPEGTKFDEISDSCISDCKCENDRLCPKCKCGGVESIIQPIIQQEVHPTMEFSLLPSASESTSFAQPTMQFSQPTANVGTFTLMKTTPAPGQ
ncbi:hypothetical protein SNEBB_010990, partial [Seison nebaliae]